MFLEVLKKIYYVIPLQPVRKGLFLIFCLLVKDQKKQKTIEGITYLLDLGETIDLCIYLKNFEPDIHRALEHYCQKGMTVFDIGANVGAHALPLAKITGEQGKVYAFEPTEYAYKKLRKNISLNNFHHLFPIQLVLSDRNIKQQEIDFRSSWLTIGKSVQRKTMVDFIKLDDWCLENNITHIDLIKLDVDGNEYCVIMGAKAVLERDRPCILMEVWGPNFSDRLKNPFFLLDQWGYHFFDLKTEERLSISDLENRVSSNGKLLDHSFNIIAKCGL